MMPSVTPRILLQTQLEDIESGIERTTAIVGEPLLWDIEGPEMDNTDRSMYYQVTGSSAVSTADDYTAVLMKTPEKKAHGVKSLPSENFSGPDYFAIMGRFLTLYRTCSRKDCDCKDKDTHVVREINWNFNERGLCNWIEDNYNFHYRKKPEVTFYQVTSLHDGNNISVYNRQQFYETVKYYFDRIQPELQHGTCYIFPSGFAARGTLKLITDDQGQPMKYPLSPRDVQFYQAWMTDLMSFSREYFDDESLVLGVSD